MTRILPSVLCLGWTAAAHAGGMDVPGTIAHQGVIAVHGERFTGDGLFRFALVDAGDKYLWVNDGIAVAHPDPPTNAVTLMVINGVYNVGLGDVSLPNMTAIPLAVFNDSDVALRIWFDDGHGNGVHRLSPDLKLTAVPYALRLPNVTVDQGTGKVGIGTTNPDFPLHLEAGSPDALASFVQLDPAGSGLHIKPGSDNQYGLLINNAANDTNRHVLVGDGRAAFALGGGNVGIGTAFPDFKLEVRGVVNDYGNANIVASSSGDSVGVGVYAGTRKWDMVGIVSTGNDDYFAIVDSTTVPTERLAITETGNVGIGTTSPFFKLDVAGDIATSGYRQFVARYDASTDYRGTFGWNTMQLGNNSTNYIVAGRTSPGGELAFVTNNTNDVLPGQTFNGMRVMTLAANGNVGIGTDIPSGHMFDVVSTQGTVGNSAIRARYSAGGLPGSEFGAIAHRDGFWTSLYAKQGNASSAAYFDGNVGIGTTSPAGKLHIKTGQVQNFLSIEAEGANHAGVLFRNGTQPNNFIFTEGSSGNLYFQTNNGNRMVIDTAGNVGIGTASPGYKLDVEGPVRARDGIKVPIRWASTTFSGEWFVPDTSSWYQIPGLTVSNIQVNTLSLLDISYTGGANIGDGVVLTSIWVDGIIATDSAGNVLYARHSAGHGYLTNIYIKDNLGPGSHTVEVRALSDLGANITPGFLRVVVHPQ